MIAVDAVWPAAVVSALLAALTAKSGLGAGGGGGGGGGGDELAGTACGSRTSGTMPSRRTAATASTTES